MKSLLGPSPLAPEEDRLRATATADLDALRAAEVATNGLGYLSSSGGSRQTNRASRPPGSIKNGRLFS